MVTFKDLKISEFKGEFECFCGRKHIVRTEIIFSKNALEQLSDAVVKILPVGNILYITAKDLKEKSKSIESVLYKTHMLNVFEFEPNFKPSLECVAKLMNIPEGYRLIICFGSGSITDISKYFASLKNLPLICIASAPSTLAYLNDYSVLYKNGLKQSFKSVSPDVLAVDLNIMLDSPKNMIAAGFGIVLGSAIAMFDLQISAILNEENICENITDLIKKALQNVIISQDKLINPRIDSVEVLTESLLYLSLASQLAGLNVGGAESSVADTLELILKDKEKKLYGELVYICLNKIIKMYEMFLNSSPTTLLLPADLAERSAALAELTHIPEQEFLKTFLDRKEYDHELYLHKLAEYQEELYNTILEIDKTISKTLTIFKRIYNDKGYSIQNYASAADFKKAVYLAPAVDSRFTLLAFMTELGYLENAGPEKNI